MKMKTLSARFKECDDYLAKPYRTRRWLVGLATVLSLGLVVYVNAVDQQLHGEAVILTLLGGSQAIYGGSKIVESFTDKTPADDI
jgi:hypothetical protein